ncbi:metal ABC transporter substrate-binding protein [Chloroflexus sp.]|uniref:metal ABC transporter substrate-binding protein n=1 Tax=Chloroflexus sp. TaxID=1904827 RepID=UPI0026152BE6|nr:metal ABC transporter substrate-binding protein [uncultured Chloroflexus sp.]
MNAIQRVFIIALVVLLVAGCGQAPASQTSTAPEPIAVMASTSIVADVVRQIGGERVQVATIVPIGADAHNYEPSPQDLARVNEARAIFTVGAGYEEFIERLITSSGTQAEVVALSEGLVLRELSAEEAVGHSRGEEHGAEHGDEHGDEHSDEHGDEHSDEHGEEHSHAAGTIDGHTWTDPANVKAWADLIASTLSRIDPAGATMYTSRAADYQRQLDELDRWIAEQFAAIPAERRLIVSDHIIFGYLADRYGLRQLGAIIPGVSTSAAPSAQELAALQDLIADHGVTAIFVGDIANQQLAEQIARDTGIKIVPVLTESLTDTNGPGATYIDYMRYNVQQMADALRG